MTTLIALRYVLCDHPVTLVTDDRALAAPLRRLFPAYVRDGASTASPHIIVRRTGPGYRVETDRRAPVTCHTKIEVMATCEFALGEALLASCPDYVHLHAAGAVVPSGAVLALGRAGAGKSSLALAWSRRGHAALGDDVVLLDAQGRAHAFCRFFKVSPALLEESGVDPTATPFWVPESVDAWYDPADGAGWADPAPVAAIVLARFQRGAPLRIRSASSAEGLNALVHSVLPLGRDRHTAFDVLARLVERAPVCEVTFGDAAAAAAVLTGPPAA